MSDRSTAATVPPARSADSDRNRIWASQMLLVAAQLELADRLGDGSKTSDQLATFCDECSRLLSLPAEPRGHGSIG